MTSPRADRSRRNVEGERRFLGEVAAGGFTMAESAAYKDSKTPVLLVCAQGHRCPKRPGDLYQGKGCRACAGKDPASAKAAFLASVDALGAQLAEGASYVNGSTPVRLICAKGHECRPWPASVQQGRGICLTCAGMNPPAARAAFFEAVAAQGGALAEGAVYVNTRIPVQLVCAQGHGCSPHPTSVQQGHGICSTCAGNNADAAQTAFWSSVAASGAAPAPEAIYVNACTPVQLICAQGHRCSPRPSGLQRGHGICSTCAGNDSVAAEAAFWNSVATSGATPVAGARYKGSNTPVHLICVRGHHCSPSPTSLQQGGGVCRACAGQDPILAEGEFLAALDAFGARLAEGAVYVDSRRPIRVICAKGHECSPRPSSVQQGGGVCLTCAGMDPAAAKAAFFAEVTASGATLAEGSDYVKSGTPIKLLCAKGHPYSKRPNDLQQGKRACLTCAGLDPVVAEASFLAAVAALGARLDAGATYCGTNRAVRLICVQGHHCNPTPASVRRGRGICQTCVGTDPIAAEAEFWVRVAERGGYAASDAVYRGSKKPVHLICSAGHSCNPRPSSVHRGGGICEQCFVTFDRVYLLVHPVGAIKVGIASGDSRVRGHVGRGYQVVTEWRDLSHDRAVAAEKQAIAYWRAQGWPQVNATPKSGRTETCSSVHLPETRAWLAEFLDGDPVVLGDANDELTSR